MNKYEIEIQQTYTYKVVIEADTEEQAETIFSEYIEDDFGTPTGCFIEWEMNEVEGN